MKKCLSLIIFPFQKSNNPGHNLRSLSPIPDCSSADERDYDITPRRGHPKVSGFFFTYFKKRKGKKVSRIFNMCPSLIRDEVSREYHVYRTICFSSTSQSNFFSSSQQNFWKKFCVLLVNAICYQHTKFFLKFMLGTWKKIWLWGWRKANGAVHMIFSRNIISSKIDDYSSA